MGRINLAILMYFNNHNNYKATLIISINFQCNNSNSIINQETNNLKINNKIKCCMVVKEINNFNQININNHNSLIKVNPWFENKNELFMVIIFFLDFNDIY